MFSKRFFTIVLLLCLGIIIFIGGCIFVPPPPSTYSINATVGEGGQINPEGLLNINEGDNQVFTIIPNEGYQIADVLVDNESVGVVEEYTFQNIQQNHTLHASFDSIAYTLTMGVDPDEGGISTDITDNGPYAAGTVVTISALANAGYSFINWTSFPTVTFDDVNAADTTFIMPKRKVRVTANFAPGLVRNVDTGVYYSSIQAAIDASVDGETIIVYTGTYYEQIVFNGRNITVRSSDPSNPAIVSATIIDGEGSGHVVEFSGGDTSTLEGFTIQNGSAALHGGGIRIYSSSSHIIGNTITGNLAPNGGGIYINAGSPAITGNTISNNDTSGYGGGIDMNDGSSPNITGNTISNNTADNGGGGISMLLSSPIIDGNDIESNTSDGWSGGIDVDASSFPIIQNNSITNNAAAGPGGGVAVSQNCDLLPYDDRPTGWGSDDVDDDGYRENIPSYVSPVAGNTFSGNTHLGGLVDNGADVYFSTTRSTRTFADYLR